MSKVFEYSVQHVLDDIIRQDLTFWFPSGLDFMPTVTYQLMWTLQIGSVCESL